MSVDRALCSPCPIPLSNIGIVLVRVDQSMYVFDCSMQKGQWLSYELCLHLVLDRINDIHTWFFFNTKAAGLIGSSMGYIMHTY